MGPTGAVCALLKDAAENCHGAGRRGFLARTVNVFGLSQRRAERKRGWARATVREALQGDRPGIRWAGNVSARGRKPAEFRLPPLLADITDLVKEDLPADPTFRTTGLYCRASSHAATFELDSCWANSAGSELSTFQKS